MEDPESEGLEYRLDELLSTHFNKGKHHHTMFQKEYQFYSGVLQPNS